MFGYRARTATFHHDFGEINLVAVKKGYGFRKPPIKDGEGGMGPSV